ncbi:tRNA glutamyl-Q(34) synthetase GluQRS [Roseobacter sp. CCS2]|uniref:tRNA glutamyl-Q(34) synthetase GluQRS n=1 Tax=Roseobacter sp. CCS2 TaxID=391593 RepID=UPI0000F3FCDD|nr:tRNA glutamyl-Q(34) synthetase GluQRS [Roseobacter sp. CCS2]EBA10859.1 glutamyl-tRNA synthetase, class Ic [Roseobacter sp. CCS2]
MITRFAPSPTGPLHLGHAYAALTVWKVAQNLRGTALLRIEDTDSTRVRPAYEAGIYEDLKWLGLEWPTPARRQSAHYGEYDAVLERLAADGLIYPCGCTRRNIVDAGARPGADGMVYPGTCRHRAMSDANAGDGIRLNIRKALDRVSGKLSYIEIRSGQPQTIEINDKTLLDDIGDPILKRKDTGDPAYHLACVHDDAVQGITHVVRGADLRDLTPIHVLIQRLLGYATPIYDHHRLITDDSGKRLAKISKAKAISKFRAEGLSSADIKNMIGFKD